MRWYGPGLTSVEEFDAPLKSRKLSTPRPSHHELPIIGANLDLDPQNAIYHIPFLAIIAPLAL